MYWASKSFNTKLCETNWKEFKRQRCSSIFFLLVLHKESNELNGTRKIVEWLHACFLLTISSHFNYKITRFVWLISNNVSQRNCRKDLNKRQNTIHFELWTEAKALIPKVLIITYSATREKCDLKLRFIELKNE